MRFYSIKKLTIAQKWEILLLWNKEYPRNLEFKNIEELDNYLNQLKDKNHILILDENDTIKGWYADFLRNDERWFLAILDSEIQGKKYGTKLMNLAKQNNDVLNGWVIPTEGYIKFNGQPYITPIGFYIKQGFKIQDDQILESAKISAVRIRWTGRTSG